MSAPNRVEASTSSEVEGHLVNLADCATHPSGSPESGDERCRLLECGKILHFPVAPFPLRAEHTAVLLRQRLSQAGWHKNIAYRPREDRVTGFDARHADAADLHEALRTFSRQTLDYVARLLPRYAACWRLDYASFRPLEEQGRQLRLHARNDLIHVDSFPKRPTHGDRILRIFLNINPSAERHWITGQPLDVLADEMGADFARLLAPAPPRGVWDRAVRLLTFSGRSRSSYDQTMRGIHQRMKESSHFQLHCRKHHSHFAPGSAWLVFTDAVPHAVVSGQYALEQTVIVPRSAMLLPQKSPAAVLQRLAEVRMRRLPSAA